MGSSPSAPVTRPSYSPERCPEIESIEHEHGNSNVAIESPNAFAGLCRRQSKHRTIMAIAGVFNTSAGREGPRDDTRPPQPTAASVGPPFSPTVALDGFPPPLPLSASTATTAGVVSCSDRDASPWLSSSSVQSVMTSSASKSEGEWFLKRVRVATPAAEAMQPSLGCPSGPPWTQPAMPTSPTTAQDTTPSGFPSMRSPLVRRAKSTGGVVSLLVRRRTSDVLHHRRGRACSSAEQSPASRGEERERGELRSPAHAASGDTCAGDGVPAFAPHFGAAIVMPAVAVPGRNQLLRPTVVLGEPEAGCLSLADEFQELCGSPRKPSSFAAVL